MRIAAFTCLLTALPAFALADILPGYYQVTGVAADDTLNVRAEPSASSADIGDLAHDATAIEVSAVDPTGKWGQIIWQEGDGWIAMRFLAPFDVQRIPGTVLPAGLTCAGTEPFWSLAISVSSGSYFDPSGVSVGLGLSSTQVAAGRLDYPVHVALSGSGVTADATIRPLSCSDGMSDRTMPWGVDVILRGQGQSRFVTGCCRLPLEAGSH